MTGNSPSEKRLYRTILADPPWPLALAGQRKRNKEGKKPVALPYPTMSISQIERLQVGYLAAIGCHLWLWTTNQHLSDGFSVMKAWGFKYLAPIHWIKPTGQGNWFIHRTQTILFGYKEKCVFELERYRPNLFTSGDPLRHSQKPEESYLLVEAISSPARLELFARRKRPGWDAWGDEIKSDVEIAVAKKPEGASRSACFECGYTYGTHKDTCSIYYDARAHQEMYP